MPTPHNPRSRRRAVPTAAAVAAAITFLLALLWLQHGATALPVDPQTHHDTHSASPAPQPSHTPAGPVRREARVPPAREDAMLRGRVEDAAGLPVADAVITLGGLPPGASTPADSTVRSDHLGRFELTAPRHQPVELLCLGPQHRPQRVAVSAPQDDVLVVLERTPMLHGRVVHGDRRSASGALVRWSTPHLPHHPGATTTTDDDGRFSFSSLPWAVDLEVLAEGALPVHRHVVVDWRLPELRIELDAGRPAGGQVVAAEDGTGLAGATVSLWYYASTFTSGGQRGGAAQHAETATTADDGRFQLHHLPSSTDRRRAPAWLWVSAPGRAPHAKLLANAERIEDLVVELHRTGAVRGRVVDARGAPLANHRVLAESAIQPLCDAGGNPGFRRQDAGWSTEWLERSPDPAAPFHGVREANTDADGTYRIEGLPCPPGGCQVTVSLAHPGGAVRTLLTPGATADAADLVLPDDLFYRRSGTVVDRLGEAIHGAVVVIGTLRTTTDAHGGFQLRGMPHADQLSVTAHGYAPYRRSLPADADPMPPIVLEPAHAVTVHVTDRQRANLPDALVQVFAAEALAPFLADGPKPASLLRARTDDLGHARLAAVPERFDLLVEFTDAARTVHRRTLTEERAATGRIEVQLEDFELGLAQADLTVVLIEGKSGMPLARPARITAASTTQTLQHGMTGPTLKLPGLPVGEWRILVAAEGMLAVEASLTLDADRELRIELGGASTLTGQLSTTTNGSFTDLDVVVRHRTTGISATTRAAPDGTFVVTGLSPGEYSVEVPPTRLANDDGGGRHRTPQTHTSPVPGRVVAPGTPTHLSIVLPVIPIATVGVIVTPPAAVRSPQQVWAWAHELTFEVVDNHGVQVGPDRATSILTNAAEWCLPVAVGEYRATVRWRGTILGTRPLRTGEHWRLPGR